MIKWFSANIYGVDFEHLDEETKESVYMLGIGWYFMIIVSILMLPILIANTF